MFRKEEETLKESETNNKNRLFVIVSNSVDVKQVSGEMNYFFLKLCSLS